MAIIRSFKSAEDQTKFTAMSIHDIPSSFDGNFRSLDWLALTKLYGVNPSYNSDDNYITLETLEHF